MTKAMKNIRSLAFLMEQNGNVKCLFFYLREKNSALKQKRSASENACW